MCLSVSRELAVRCIVDSVEMATTYSESIN